jgi:hypothetical protein
VRRGAHRTRRGPAGVLLLVLVWLLVAAVLVVAGALLLGGVLSTAAGLLGRVL